jgi:aspartyl protease family protein
MDPDSGARLLYLSLLGAFLFLIVFRTGFGIARLIRILLFWGLVVAGLATAYTLYQESTAPRAALTIDGGEIVIPRGPDGHFHATLGVNGEPIPFVIDTGASEIVLSREAADAAGIDLDALIYLGRARTANGVVRTAPVRLDTLTLAGQTVRDVRASVNEGALDVSLLGMSYLDRYSRIEIAGDQLRLVP